MPRSLLFNNAILFLCCSIYLGTGVTLVFFQLPLATQLTPENYAIVFVQPIALATTFFTWTVTIMLITGTIMAITEWFSGIRWLPILVLLSVSAAASLTVFMIFPINQQLAAGVADQAEVSALLGEFGRLSRIRFCFWVFQWLLMMYWFARLAARGRADR